MCVQFAVAVEDIFHIVQQLVPHCFPIYLFITGHHLILPLICNKFKVHGNQEKLKGALYLMNK